MVYFFVDLSEPYGLIIVKNNRDPFLIVQITDIYTSLYFV